MNKNELKQYRKELVDSMRKLRVIQKRREQNILENKDTKDKFPAKIDNLMIGLLATYNDMLDDLYINGQKERKRK